MAQALQYTYGVFDACACGSCIGRVFEEVNNMSLSAVAKRAATRTVAPAVSSPFRVARRNLGDTVRGPQAFDIPANFKYATEFFTKGSVSYMEFKQQCVSLRLFTVPCVTVLCVLALAMDPPKSSYWQRYSPKFLFSNTKSLFMGTSSPLFLLSKAEREADVPFITKELIMNRRLPGGAGSDSEEEH